MFNLKNIRSDFPILAKTRNNKPFIYFDNAATTQKPKVVIDKICDFYSNYNSNIQRGMYFLADKATSEYEKSREIISKFLNSNLKEEIIFTSGTTHSVNMVAFGYLKKLVSKGDEVLIGEMEHHANIVPWQVIASKLELKIIPIKCCENGKIKLDDLIKKINPKVKLLAIQHISNITGHENNIKKICSIAHKKNVRVFVDGAQAVSHKNINLQDLNCDFYSFSGHKCFGPTGVGVLFGKRELLLEMDPFFFGGNMINKVSFSESSWGQLPHKFEAGTSNIAGVIGLGASIKYLLSLGFSEIQKREGLLIEKMWAELYSNENIIIQSSAPPDSPILSFNIKKLHSYDIGSLLDEMNICVRTGQLCAQPAIKAFDVSGFIRASLCFYNTENEIEEFISSIKKIIKIL